MSLLDLHHGSLAEDLLEPQGTEVHEDQHDAEKESRIADPVHDESLLAGIAGALLFKIEADEQIRAEAHPFPPYKHQDEIVRQHQGQHREHEKIEVGEKAIVAAVVPHIPGRIHVDQETNAGDDQNHYGRERIQLQPHGHFEGFESSTGERQAAGVEPGVIVRNERLAVLQHESLHGYGSGKQKRKPHDGERHRRDNSLAQLPAPEPKGGEAGYAEDGTPCEGKNRNQPDIVEHGPGLIKPPRHQRRHSMPGLRGKALT